MAFAPGVVRERAAPAHHVFDVERLECTANGESFTREVVRHPGAVAVIAAEAGEVVLVRQWRAPLRRVLEVVAGTCDVAGEEPAATAARELEEEAGLRAASIEPLCEVLNAPGWCDQRTTVFVASGLTAVPAVPGGPRRRPSRSCASGSTTPWRWCSAPPRLRRDHRRRGARPPRRGARGERAAASGVRGVPRLVGGRARACARDRRGLPSRPRGLAAFLAGARRAASRRRDRRRRGAPRRGIGAGARTATVARLASTLRGLYGFLLDEGGLVSTPRRCSRTRRAATRLPVVLTEPQVTALLAAPPTDAPVGARDRAVLELLYGTGITSPSSSGSTSATSTSPRSSYASPARVDKQRLVPLGRAAAFALSSWLAAPHATRCSTPRRLPRDTARCSATCAVAGSPAKASTWSCADTPRVRPARGDERAHAAAQLATHMLARGADVRVIQELLGHARWHDQRYTKVTPTHLIEAYPASHPGQATRVPGT